MPPFRHLAALLCLTLLAACSKKAGPAAAPATLVFARGSDATKLDPADIDDGESVNALAQICEGLVRFKPGTFEVEPCLARSWSVKDGGLLYLFDLRNGVTFHDGTPLTAETAAFTFQRQLDPKHPAHLPGAGFQYWGTLFPEVTEVKAVGLMSLAISLKQPNGTLLSSLATFPAWLISPRSYDTYKADMQSHPVGTGPYQFKEWKPNEAIVLEANRTYWGEPKPAFQRLVIRPVRENAARLLQLRSGEVHVLTGLDPAELAGLRADPSVKVVEGPGLNVGYLSINHDVAQLRHPDVRRAMALAIDRDALVKLALAGAGSPAVWPLPPGFLGVPKTTVSPIRFDREEARRLLAAHPEATREPLEMATLNEPRIYFPDPVKVASLLRADLEAVGFKINVTARDRQTHMQFMRDGKHQLGLLGWVGDVGDPDNFLSMFFHTASARRGFANNVSFYLNPEMDKLLDEGRREGDPNNRQALYEKALGLWARDLPLIPLCHANDIVVLRREVGGFVLDKGGNVNLGPVNWQP